MGGTLFIINLQQAIEKIGLFISSAFGWVASVVTEIASKPVLFIFVVAVPLVTLGVSIFNRLIKAN